ncbi:Metallo-dependent hydrolase [Mycena crocata]|nr:Metallo-dependent hydrolase [Mycena crocata]
MPGRRSNYRPGPSASSAAAGITSAKKAPAVIPETNFLVTHAAVSPTSPIVDTHTHLALTFESYRRKYPDGQYQTAWDFVHALYAPAGVEQMVDVWMEAPVRPIWRQYADSALTEEGRRDLWGGVGYWFVMGVHPHNAKHYTDKVEADIIEAMAHPRCVGWGEMGLDYHYDTSPRPVQREVFARQLRCAVRLNKPLTIHSREADADTERILKDEVPKNHKIHIHCFTDAPAFAQRLLDWFPNLYIGVTGVVTYSSNTDTSTTIRNMFASSNSTENLRIVLETDAPYMIPSTIYATPSLAGKKFPLCHCGMLPWTAAFVAKQLPAANKEKKEEGWDTARVMKVSRENARNMYGV